MSAEQAPRKFIESPPSSYDKEALSRNLAEKLNQYPHTAQVKDLITGEIILSENSHGSVFPASTTKTIIAYGALTLGYRGSINLDDPVRIEGEVGGSTTPPDKLGGPPRVGENVPMRTLIKQMLIYSDNTASNNVLREVGLERMQGIIKNELGLAGTDIERGYFQEGKPLRTTPDDMISFLDHTYSEVKTGDGAAKELFQYMQEGSEWRYGKKIDKNLVVVGKYGANELQEHQVGIVLNRGNVFAMAVYANDMPQSKAVSFYADIFNTFKTEV